MRLAPVLILIIPLICACSPAPPATMQNQTTQQTPTPKKDKSIHVSEKGWAP
jgi:hypothetical protein